MHRQSALVCAYGPHMISPISRLLPNRLAIFEVHMHYSRVIFSVVPTITPDHTMTNPESLAFEVTKCGQSPIGVVTVALHSSCP